LLLHQDLHVTNLRVFGAHTNNETSLYFRICMGTEGTQNNDIAAPYELEHLMSKHLGFNRHWHEYSEN